MKVDLHQISGLFRGRRLSTSAKIVLIALVIILLTAAGVVVMILYQIGTGYIDNPRFCGTCHIMSPFVEAWETSVHGQTFVKCHLCHPTGYETLPRIVQYVVGAYRTPVIVDFSNSRISNICSSCHIRTGLHKTYGHEEVPCRLCHGMHGPGIEVPSPPYCMECHTTLPGYMKRTNCLKCHPRDEWGSPRGHIVEDGKLPIDTCSDCHVVSGLHDKHSEISCSTCHTQGGFRGIIPRQIVCTSCHADQLEKFPDQLCNECHTRHAWGGRRVT